MKRATIRLAGRFCEIQVKAEVFGSWAVHRGTGPALDADWRVSHVPSGLALVTCSNLENARRAARLLQSLRAGESVPTCTVSMTVDADWVEGALYSEHDLDALCAAVDLAHGYEVQP